MNVKINDRALLALSTGILAGSSAAISLVSVPSILASSDPLPVWKVTYDHGKKIALTNIAISAITGIGAFLKRDDWTYLIVTGLAATMVPYTLLVMLPTNKALFAIQDSERTNEDKIKKLVKKWGKLQYVRTLLAVGAFVATAVIVTKK